MNPLFQDEIQLAGWSESHNSGAKITFWLSDPAQLEVFRGMTARKGNTAGQRLACVLVEIDDQEQPVANEVIPTQPDHPQVPLKIGPLCLLAVQLCEDLKFWEWASLDMKSASWTCGTTDQAKNYILKMCGIGSRKDLDINEDAAIKFHQRIRKPFNAWLNKEKS